MKTNIYFLIISRSLFLVLKKVSDKCYRENQNTHLMFKNPFYENFKIKWENMEEPDMPQMTIWRMCIACWIPKATNENVSICNTYSFSTESMDARTSLSVT
jgi:hypothetical protein